ncbi:MAG TPA: fluoride efflux transporter CrcB [Rhodocyclaceae bacterium]|nr:fluoride efflux transporter CrcB [Rhodocyclaceae bacterium]
MFNSVLAVGVGAALGAWLRWLANIKLTPLLHSVALGTLTVNLIGGYLIGVAAEVFLLRADTPPEWRLFIITGFLGGLTTFSSFSGEVVGLLLQNRVGPALATITLNLCGSLIMTWLGIVTIQSLR